MNLTKTGAKAIVPSRHPMVNLRMRVIQIQKAPFTDFSNHCNHFKHLKTIFATVQNVQIVFD